MWEEVVVQVLVMVMVGVCSLGSGGHLGSTTLVLLSFDVEQHLGTILGMCSGCRNI